MGFRVSGLGFRGWGLYGKVSLLELLQANVDTFGFHDSFPSQSWTLKLRVPLKSAAFWLDPPSTLHLDPRHPLLGTLYPYLRVLGGSFCAVQSPKAPGPADGASSPPLSHLADPKIVS